MSAPAMPTELDTHEDAVEAVIAQVSHAQDAARRSDRDLVARRTAERIVDAFDVARPDVPALAVAAAPDLDLAYASPVALLNDLRGALNAARDGGALTPAEWAALSSVPIGQGDAAAVDALARLVAS